MTSVSVVVGLTSGGTDHLRRCLRSLTTQTLPLQEVLVPYDDACAGVTTLQTEFESARFIRVPGLDTREARRGASREHHDTLRTAGLRAATGDVILMTEDYACASPEWAAGLVGVLARHPEAGGAGGAIECEGSSALTFAIWLCDFGRYQCPLLEQRTHAASDVNVAYRTAALTHVAAAWRDAYREPAVHAALEAAGYPIYLAPDAVVCEARGTLPLRQALRERFIWGRSYAATRPDAHGSRRWLLAVLSPLLPLLLTWRIGATTVARGRHVRRFLTCAPLVVGLTTAWAAGELVGYVSGRPA
ncbi:MAG: hypothetical protein ABL982_05565 [Vicinamibacterales bacterium]